jgi:hypothetical protein
LRHQLTALVLLALVGCGDDTSLVADRDGSLAPADGAPGTPDAAPPGTPDAAPPGTPDANTSTSDCGTCPPGYTCGTANGTPVCRAASGIPRFSSIYVVLMENTSYATLEATTNTPFLHGLGADHARSADYHGVIHPSLANYLALVSGDTYGIGCDCDPTGGACNGFNCNIISHSCGCSQSATTIADQIEAAGLDWRMYGEGMGMATPCKLTGAGNYAPRHVPFVYFSTLVADAARCEAHVVDYGHLAADLAAPRAFNFISPDLVHDMHDPFPAGAQNYANGDMWLATEMAHLLARPELQPGGRGLLVIVWDEDDASGFPNPDDPIPMYVVSPLAKAGGYKSMVHADHYNLLATFEDGLALPRLGKAQQATPMIDFFPAQ